MRQGPDDFNVLISNGKNVALIIIEIDFFAYFSYN
jgi:hypothetical protein